MEHRQKLQVFSVVGHLQSGKSSIVAQLKASDETNGEEIKLDSTELIQTIDTQTIEKETGRTFIHTYHFLNSPTVIQNTPGSLCYFKEIYRSIVLADVVILIVSPCGKESSQNNEKTTKNLIVAAFVAGIKDLVIVVNKMDQVDYSSEYFFQQKQNITKITKNVGYSKSLNIHFIPTCVTTGGNILQKDPNMRWYSGPTVQSILSTFTPREFDINNPLILPVQKIKTIPKGTVFVGRIISGIIEPGVQFHLDKEGGLPSTVREIQKKKTDVKVAFAGDFVSILVQNASRKLIRTGYLLQENERNIPIIKSFSCKVKILYKKINNGCIPVLSCFCAQGPCKWQLPEGVESVKKGTLITVHVVCHSPMRVLPYHENQFLGRVCFRFRDEIIAAGVVLETNVDSSLDVVGRLTKAAR